MKVAQTTLRGTDFKLSNMEGCARIDPHLLMVFGSLERLEDPALFTALRHAFPFTHFAGCSTHGEILGHQLQYGTVSLTAVSFDAPSFRYAVTRVQGPVDSFGAGERICEQLAGDGLHDVLLLAPGVDIRARELMAGLRSKLKPGVRIIGGMAGDGAVFERTLVMTDDAVSAHHVLAIGFYGDRVRFSHAAMDGEAIQSKLVLAQAAVGHHASMAARDMADELVRGAQEAARIAQRFGPEDTQARLALYVSSASRKRMMGVHMDEEVKAVAEVFGQNCPVTGFFAHGQLSPAIDDTAQPLDNQAAAVTCLWEASNA